MVRPADWSALKPSARSAASLVILFQLDLGLALFDSIRYTPENYMEPEIHVPLKRKQYLNQTSSDFGFEKFIFQGFSVFFRDPPI